MVGEKQHTQEERVKIIQKGVRALASTQDAGEDPWGPTLAKERQNVSFCLNQLRHYLRDTEDPDEKYKQELQALSLLVAHMGLIKDLVRSIALIDFEGRKIVSLVFRQLLQRYAKADDGFTVAYLRRNSEILTDLIRGYALADASSACCGQMLRECAKHEDLARFLLNNKEGMRELFQHVHLAEFDVASDAFASLRELLVTHKALVAEFLDSNFTEFFGAYETLLKSDNYVTKRQSLRLLAELLMARDNYKVMTKYIEDPDKLKVMMNLLREKPKALRHDAFHIFKVFVENPKKDKRIIGILVKNKEKLVQFMSKFNTEDCDDDQMIEDRELVLKTIQALASPEAPVLDQPTTS